MNITDGYLNDMIDKAREDELQNFIRFLHKQTHTIRTNDGTIMTISEVVDAYLKGE